MLEIEVSHKKSPEVRPFSGGCTKEHLISIVIYLAVVGSSLLFFPVYLI